MLKISALFISLFARQTFAYTLTTRFGACVDEALYSGNYTGFHCDYTGDNCKKGETWVRPEEVRKGGYPACACGENFEANPLMRGCYNGGGLINCRPQHEAACEGYNMTNRMKTGPGIEVSPTCGHGSLGFGAFDASPYCGKRCTCSYGYHSGNNEMRSMIFAGETNHGYCESTDMNPKKKKNKSYCSASPDCGKKHTYVESHTLEALGITCPCDRTRSGACVKGKKGKRKLRRCAVAEDSCLEKGEKFLSVTALKKERNMGIDCMLCMNTWSCEDNSKYKFTNKSGRKLSCAKIAKSNNREQYCKKEEKIRKNCANTCEQCCSDDVRKVLFTENMVEVTCGMLGMREDKFARCEDPEIASTCKKTCGTPPCANDDD